MNTPTEKAIISAVDRQLIKNELTEERFVRDANKGNFKIFIVNGHNAPNTLREIGRLREIAFRSAGGGTGEELDLDLYDIEDPSYEQLIVFDPDNEEIVGGYRYIDCQKALLSNTASIPLSTAHYFNFSEQFVTHYLPYTIELGRSWVQPMYQPSIDPRKGLFALYSLWDGLGALVQLYPKVRYFFGKVTMYPEYDREARDLLLSFMHHYFPDPDQLVTPIHPLEFEKHTQVIKNEFDVPFKHGLRTLKQMLKERGESIPPLINLYMGLSSTMKTFGTALNPDFGDVEETGILITIEDIYETSKSRHVNSFDIPKALKLN